jgi:hypothetical protein
MLDKTIQILNYNIGKKSCIGLGELSQIKKQVYHDLQKEFADVTPEIVYEIFKHAFNIRLLCDECICVFFINENLSIDYFTLA